MQRIFSAFPVSDGEFPVTGDDAHHMIRVLRMRPGESFVVSEPSGTDAVCRVTAIDGDVLYAVRTETRPNPAEPPYRATLYQGMPKSDKPDVIVQKAVELGVSRIVFVVTERAVARPDAASVKKRIERLSRIAESAAAQCGRAFIPTVAFAPDYAAALAEAAGADLPLFCYEGGGEPLPALLASAPATRPFTVSVFIGPEGGFSEKEAAMARDAGMKACTFGARILRTETAGGHLLSCLSYQFESM